VKFPKEFIKYQVHKLSDKQPENITLSGPNGGIGLKTLAKVS